MEVFNIMIVGQSWLFYTMGLENVNKTLNVRHEYFTQVIKANP